MAPRTTARTPAERLLEALGPVDRFHDPEELGDFGMPARSSMEDLLEPVAKAGPASRLGPLEKVHVFWFAGMSCDGCTVSVTGAQAPSVESLLMGAHPGLPRVILHHPVVNVESGPNYLRAHELAIKGELGAPYAIVLEGSITDETVAMQTGGYWSGQGEEPWGPDGELRTVSTDEWIARLAPGAAASIAIGTCATWGGVPSAHGNPTGAMSLMDFLGRDYRSALGVPVVNIPGCAPVGDNFTETVAMVLLFLNKQAPLPEFDELGRPAWRFGETVHRHCPRAGYYEVGTFAKEYGDKECLVEIGCWGPVVNCNIVERGAEGHMGGCMVAGGVCIGCTMPGFPDKFTPFYKRPPGSRVSGALSRIVGAIVRPLRRTTQLERNREPRWGSNVPSGWAMQYDRVSLSHHALEYFYDKLQYFASQRPGRQRAAEKYRSGYVTPAEAAYGPDYQVLPEERERLARKRGAPRRPEL